jgi:hypothetical protein
VISYAARKDFDEQALTRILDSAPDWVRFAPGGWLIWTSRTPREWYARLRKVMQDGDNILIFEANLGNRAGFMPSSFWQFIKTKTAQDTGEEVIDDVTGA